LHPHFRNRFRGLGEDAPEQLRHFAKYRRGRGFAGFFGSVMEEAGFDRAGFRTGRKLASDDLQLLLLALIADRPSHGYDLIKLLDERSGGYYVPSPGMIYPALTYLEEAGYATVEPDGAKKLYRITEQGRGYLDQNRATVDALLSQLARIGSRMGDVRRAFAGEDDDSDYGDNHDLRQARRELRQVLRDHKHASAEESRRIAEVLRRAATEIAGKK
jgi:DNA-binding PadR family transcriptional regulator